MGTRVLVTGAGGQLGRAVADEARRRGMEVGAPTHGELAIEDTDAVRAALARHRPALVVNCAAWTDVDGCELDPARAEVVNARAAGNVAAACREQGAALVHVSTDFVFDGEKDAPYTVDDVPAPISAYGRTKLQGEREVRAAAGARWYVVRASWVFGPGGRNFPRAILDGARAETPLRVVDDQVGSPTMTRDLAEALLDLGESEAPAGIYHACNEGSCSRHGFALRILAAAGMDAVPVARIRSSDVDRPARRPGYSVLDASRLAEIRGRRLPPWEDAVTRYLAEEASLR